MEDLADLFELMHGAPESFRTLRAVIRTWDDHEVGAKAFARRAEQLTAFGAVVANEGFSFHIGGEPAADGEEVEPPSESEGIARIWLERPGRLREEVEGDYPTIRVCNGERGWFSSPWDTSEQGPLGVDPRYAALFKPLAELPALDVELDGEATVAGRAGLRVRAVAREPARWDHGSIVSMFYNLGPGGADELVLAVDRERGITLRREAWLEGQLASVVEFAELEVDVPLDAELFEFVPPPNAPVRAPQAEPPRTLAEAAERASFTIFVPSEIWPRSHLMVNYSPAQEDPLIVEHVMVSYTDMTLPGIAELPRHVALFQRAADEEPDGDDGWVELDDFDCTGIGNPAGRTRLLLLRDGTRIELQATGLEPEELVAFARSLEPARTGPPPGFD